MLIVTVTLITEATTRTVSRSAFSANGISGTRFTPTFIGYTDTLVCNLIVGGKATNPMLPAVLYVYTALKATDSTINIGIRYDVSSDGTNWNATTIGTDSTTWATTTVYTAGYKLSVVPIYDPYAAVKTGIVGNHPYQRIRIIGLSATNIKPKVKLDVVFQ
jgi:hypothetical protein